MKTYNIKNKIVAISVMVYTTFILILLMKKDEEIKRLKNNVEIQEDAPTTNPSNNETRGFSSPINEGSFLAKE